MEANIKSLIDHLVDSAYDDGKNKYIVPSVHSTEARQALERALTTGEKVAPLSCVVMIQDWQILPGSTKESYSVVLRTPNQPDVTIRGVILGKPQAEAFARDFALRTCLPIRFAKMVEVTSCVEEDWDGK